MLEMRGGVQLLDPVESCDELVRFTMRDLKVIDLLARLGVSSALRNVEQQRINAPADLLREMGRASNCREKLVYLRT